MVASRHLAALAISGCFALASSASAWAQPEVRPSPDQRSERYWRRLFKKTDAQVTALIGRPRPTWWEAKRNLIADTKRLLSRLETITREGPADVSTRAACVIPDLLERSLKLATKKQLGISVGLPFYRAFCKLKQRALLRADQKRRRLARQRPASRQAATTTPTPSKRHHGVATPEACHASNVLLGRPPAPCEGCQRFSGYEARRLVRSALEQARRGQPAVARRLLRRAGALRPPIADDVARLRAVVRAATGDLSGAIEVVARWRAKYGDEAAEQLMAEVRRWYARSHAPSHKAAKPRRKPR
ncbi:MAG: hypothetical protein KC503_28655 [Myxococcales bacterium]|nr:hypothetical protein [Myxococcales bacterium]